MRRCPPVSDSDGGTGPFCFDRPAIPSDGLLGRCCRLLAPQADADAVKLAAHVRVFEDAELAYFADLGDPGRFIAIGYSALARMLVVVHLEAGGTIRIISARKASRHERTVYAKGKGLGSR